VHRNNDSRALLHHPPACLCSMKGAEADRVRKNPLGLGLLLGGAVFSYGRSCGCRKAEILAINDDGECSSILVTAVAGLQHSACHSSDCFTTQCLS
jgi:hypothetical protein